MNLLKKFNAKKIIFTTMLMTMIIHGEMLFNKLCWHDDAGTVLRGWNDGLRHGRWFHTLLATTIEHVSGMEALPVVNGAICAICIGVMACIIFEFFDIKEKCFQISLLLIFSAIPAVTGHFGYIGSAPYDFIGKLICVLSAYILCKGIGSKQNIITFTAATFLLACSLGEYQCYLTFYLSIVLIYFTYEMLQDDNTWKIFFNKAFYYVGSAVVGLGLYLLILQLFLNLFKTQLTSYAGTDTFGIVNIQEYFNRVIYAYKDFFDPASWATYNMFPFRWDGWHMGLLLGLVGLAGIILVLKMMQRKYKDLCQFLIAFALLPLALNFNFVLYGVEATHSLHMYHYVLLFVYVCVLANNIISDIHKLTRKEQVLEGCKKLVFGLTATVILLFGVLYIRYDNVCYMQAEFRQEAAISYFTSLVTRIQMTEGYDDDYPVAYINETEKKNSVDEIITYYDRVATNPYNYSIINSYNWRDYMNLWIKFNPITVDEEEYLDNEIVQEMPTYPDDGSIRVIDGVVVVKF